LNAHHGFSRGARFFLVHLIPLIMDKKEEHYTEVLMAIGKVEYHTSRAYSWTVVRRFEEAQEEAQHLAKASRELHRLLKKVNAPVDDNEVTTD
jgi:NurA-like 5'-3' nuclease